MRNLYKVAEIWKECWSISWNITNNNSQHFINASDGAWNCAECLCALINFILSKPYEVEPVVIIHLCDVAEKDTPQCQNMLDSAPDIFLARSVSLNK